MHINWAFLGEIATAASIAGTGWRLIRAINNLRNDITTGVWEHRVMWHWWKKANPVPEYPYLEPKQ